MSEPEPPLLPPRESAGASTESFDRGDVLERLAQMMQFTPQARALGLQLTRIEGARVWGIAPYRKELVGDPETGIIAGGVVTTFLDQLCGIAAVAALTEPTAVATIDLRIDYMRGATPGLDLLAEAHCIRVTSNVAFVRATCYEKTPDDPVAHAAAAFMIDPHPSRGPYKRKPAP